MPRKSKGLSEFRRPTFNCQIGGVQFRLGLETKLMGVLNVTPDSFSDGGRYLSPDRAVTRALELEREGAHLIDIGGESSRPGARPVSAKQEIKRILPVLKRLSKRIRIPLSVDTCKYEVAWAALDQGVVLVNDIRELHGDKRLAKLVARYGAGVVLMHMQGAPRTMQERPRYRNLLRDISNYLENAVGVALEAGIARQSIVLDPGFGFGKTLAQNVEILSRMDYFSKMKLPILAGLSRKSFLGSLSGAPVSDRLYGSLAAAAVAIGRGAHILRVHDVLAHRQLALVVDQTLSEGSVT